MREAYQGIMRANDIKTKNSLTDRPVVRREMSYSLGKTMSMDVGKRHQVISGKTIAKQHEGIKRPLRKLLNANPRLKVNQRIIVIIFVQKMFFTAYLLCSLRLFKLKRERQTI